MCFWTRSYVYFASHALYCQSWRKSLSWVKGISLFKWNQRKVTNIEVYYSNVLKAEYSRILISRNAPYDQKNQPHSGKLLSSFFFFEKFKYFLEGIFLSYFCYFNLFSLLIQARRVIENSWRNSFNKYSRSGINVGIMKCKQHWLQSNIIRLQEFFAARTWRKCAF